MLRLKPSVHVDEWNSVFKIKSVSTLSSIDLSSFYVVLQDKKMFDYNYIDLYGRCFYDKDCRYTNNHI